MGMKRITGLFEVTYPADDTRELEELKTTTVTGFSAGVMSYGGLVAAFTVTSAFIEPDPEPVAGDGPATPIPPEQL